MKNLVMSTFFLQLVVYWLPVKFSFLYIHATKVTVYCVGLKQLY